MPTVLRIGRYRFHFYRDQRSEPPPIHVRKFWQEPAILRNRFRRLSAKDEELQANLS